VHVVPAKYLRARPHLSELGDRSPTGRIVRGLLPILARPRGTRIVLVAESLLGLANIPGLHAYYRITEQAALGI
jgi:hypothetical protein